jgi:hypothetical protein
MTRTIYIAAALALAVTLPATPGRAQAARTFLSAAGLDTNSCTNVTTPCRHMAAAFAATAANGEIYVLDPANYGSLTITHAVSIEGHGWASIAPPGGGGGIAITINANTGDKINIIGVVLDGTALSGTNGIVFNSGGSLSVRDSVIRNFSNTGIIFQPAASSDLIVSNTIVSDNGNNGFLVQPAASSQVTVSNTVISNNGNTGIQFQSSGSSGTVAGVLDHVAMENNVDNGLYVFSSTQTTSVIVSDSVIANSLTGIQGQSSGAPETILVRNSTIANNSDGLFVAGSAVSMWVTRSAITENSSGWVIGGGGGTLLSYGDNSIVGNVGGDVAPPPIGYK